MNIPENVNAVKLLDALGKQGITGTVMGTEFLLEKPLTSDQLAEVEKAIATHDPSQTLQQKRRDPKVRQQEWLMCRSVEAKVAYLAMLMGLEDPVESGS